MGKLARWEQIPALIPTGAEAEATIGAGADADEESSIASGACSRTGRVDGASISAAA